MYIQLEIHFSTSVFCFCMHILYCLETVQVDDIKCTIFMRMVAWERRFMNIALFRHSSLEAMQRCIFMFQSSAEALSSFAQAVLQGHLQEKRGIGDIFSLSKYTEHQRLLEIQK